MKKTLKIIKSSFVFCLVILPILLSITTSVYARDPIYKAKVNVRLTWGEGLGDEPVVTREEIVKLNFTVTMEIVTGDTFGAGILEGYLGDEALIDLFIEDHPPWCYVSLKQTLLVTEVKKVDQANTFLYLHVNENAPAYGSGFIKIRVKVGDLGLIKGDEQTFTLPFKPSFFPIVKLDLPESNSKRVDPSTNALFPIVLENAGNSRLKVFFEIEDTPKEWSAEIRDSLVIEETKGTKETVYLTVIPSKGFGYHYDEAEINVKITPTFDGREDLSGTPIYATFLIQNRGLSVAGIEVILFYLVIIILIIFAIIFILRNLPKIKKKIF